MSPSSMARNSIPPNPSRWAVSISYRRVSSVWSPSASHQRRSGRYSMAGFLISRARSSTVTVFSFERDKGCRVDTRRLVKRIISDPLASEVVSAALGPAA